MTLNDEKMMLSIRKRTRPDRMKAKVKSSAKYFSLTFFVYAI
jgi:hypothetical protein